ncbi:MAG TPA: MFS transporter, partial [Thermomicrobiales bacterium]
MAGTAATSGDDIATLVDPRRWLVLAVVLAAPLLAIFDQFVVNVAIATMQRDLGASFGQIQLVVAGYALAYAVLLITGGRLGDIRGRKRTFILGLGGFTVASALCGLAPTPEFLIAARVLQGCAAALMSPQTLAIIRVTFPGREQSTAFAIYGMVLGLAGVLGQVVGGLLIRANLFGLTWRPIFLINLPVGIVATVAAIFLLR